MDRPIQLGDARAGRVDRAQNLPVLASSTGALGLFWRLLLK